MTASNIPERFDSDEIDLRGLVLVLWSAKGLIALITAVMLALAVAYAFLQPSVFEAAAKILPPTQSDLANYNIAFKLLDPALRAAASSPKQVDARPAHVAELTTKDVYAVFLRELQSEALRGQFFKKFYLQATNPSATNAQLEALWNRLNAQLVVQVPDLSRVGTSEVAQVRFLGGDPQQLADWTNAYVEMAREAAARQLVDNLKDSVRTQLKVVDDQIASLRSSAHDEREFEIARLKSALQLASAINLQQPPSSGNLITTYSGPTLYLRGAQALQAELRLLEARPSDDPYIEQLPGLLFAEKLMQKINLDPKNFSVATIDQQAARPWIRVKPKRSLILALGFVLGLTLGVLAALGRKAWRESQPAQ